MTLCVPNVAAVKVIWHKTVKQLEINLSKIYTSVQHTAPCSKLILTLKKPYEKSFQSRCTEAAAVFEVLKLCKALRAFLEPPLSEAAWCRSSFWWQRRRGAGWESPERRLVLCRWQCGPLFWRQQQEFVTSGVLYDKTLPQRVLPQCDKGKYLHVNSAEKRILVIVLACHLHWKRTLSHVPNVKCINYTGWRKVILHTSTIISHCFGKIVSSK